MMHVLSLGQAKNNDIINTTFGKTKTRQHSIHDPLKFYEGVLQPKWQKLSLISKYFS
jgi:hypothetical protein